jgi:beta-lactam-binding protein with PASTA domain
MVQKRSTRKGASKTPLQKKFLTFGKLILLAGILVAVFLFSAIIGMRFAVRGRLLVTPDIQGMAVEEAREVVSGMDLSLFVTARRYDSSIEEGSVISQLPGPGLGIKAKGEVRVVVSMGKRTHAVPDLMGTSVRAARLVAEQNHFQLGQISRLNWVAEDDGEVVAQFPFPNAEDTVDDRIDVLVQETVPEAYVMPDMIGWNLNRALRFLKTHSFEVDRIRYRRHREIARGTIVRQFPEPGYMLRQDESINLEVAR